MASAGGIRMGKVFVEIGADASKFFSAVEGINRQVGKIGASMSKVGTQIMTAGAAMAAPIVLATRQFARFDDAIRATAAVTGSLGPQGAAAFAMLNDKARELGATTSFTAVEVANLMTELGRAGFNPSEINAMTGAVLDLARATGTDATRSAGIMAATLRQFGLGAGEAARAADVLTFAANSTFNTVDGLGESLKYAGPVAKSLGMSLEDTAAILGVLGNVGIQGSEAGTALRRLAVISAGSGDKLKELFGITNTDAAGNLKPLVDILDEINTVTANMPVAERTEKMAKAFGLLGITSANVLSQSAGGVRGLADGLRNAEGTANRTAKAMDAGLGGAIRITLSAIEGTALAIGTALAPGFQKLVVAIGNTATALTNFVKDNEGLIVAVAQGVTTFLAAGAAIWTIGKGLSLLSSIVGIAIGGISAFGTVFSVAAAAVGLVLSPLGLVAIAISTIVANSNEAQQALSAAFSGVSAMLAPVGAAIAETFGPAIQGGIDLMGQLAATASTTFAGIGEAIAAGDLTMAMDVLWAGLYAGWARGSATLMNAVDPWIEALQNVFADLGTNIYLAWDDIWTSLATSEFGATILGVFDNIVNGVMATVDWLVGNIQKAWIRVNGFISGATDTQSKLDEIDAKNKANADERGRTRPGIEGRQRAAREDADKIRQESRDRQDAVRADAQAARDARAASTASRRQARNDAAAAAEANVAGMAAGAKEANTDKGVAEALIQSLSSAKDMDELTNIGQSISALIERDAISSDMISKVQAAYNAAAQRIFAATATSGDVPSTGTGGKPDPAGMQAAAAAAVKGSEAVGTFSSVGLSGMGYGSSIAQQQLDTLKRIEKNTDEIGDEGAVAA